MSSPLDAHKIQTNNHCSHQEIVIVDCKVVPFHLHKGSPRTRSFMH